MGADSVLCISVSKEPQVTFGQRNRKFLPTYKLLFLVILNFQLCQAEVYTSTAHLEQVLRVEQEVVAILEDYIQKVENKLYLIRQYVKDYERIAADDVTPTMENPLHAYHLMKRLAVDWIYVENNLHQNEWFEALTGIRERRSVLQMPEETDLQGAALALIRLKRTYRLNVTELSRGNLEGIISQVQMTARDCLFLGRNTLSLGFTDHAIEWLEHAMLLASLEGNQTAGQDEIRPYLQEAISAYDQINSARGPHVLEDASLLTDSSSESGRLEDVTENVDQPQMKLTTSAQIDPNDNALRYEALCRGQRFRTPEYESKLKCFYKDGPHPYLRLQKIKVEEQHLDPDIYTFHDIIYDSEIKLIQMLAQPQLQRSTVVGTNGVWREVSDTRTSQNTWIYDSTVQEQPILQRLHHRIQAVTGLNVHGDHAAEALQVANYGVGGHYVPHFDYLFQDKPLEELVGVDQRDLSLGDRIATLMFYLSDVSRGGATVFPVIGAAVWPRKGSAVFWHNLKSNGEGDRNTLHGACPVLHGSKWVANKWIREKEQMTTRPCGLTNV